MRGCRALTASLAAAFFAFGLIAGSDGATIGAGVGILQLPNPNNQNDTPTDGTSDQSRTNVDESFTTTLQAGTYNATTWSYNAGQFGTVTPFVAILTGADAYEVIAMGAQVDVTGGFDLDVIGVAFGGSSQFTLAAETTIYAGITNEKLAGNQNPIKTNLNSGFTVDHDNNADGLMQPDPMAVGEPVTGFGHSNLARSYAFSIEVEAIPEPASTLLTMFGLVGLGLATMRRR